MGCVSREVLLARSLLSGATDDLAPLSREAAPPVFEADRHAKVALEKHIRGVRPIERSVEAPDTAEAEVVQGYYAAVRSATTHDGRAPLAASGLKPKRRLEAVRGGGTPRQGGRARRHRALPQDFARLPVAA